jgi:N-acetyl sugar amidotransferase
MRYCKKCILPDTRPNLELDEEGVCNACKSHETKTNIDWEGREKAFRNVVENAKQASKGYDCIIPVSGGKDSHWQVVKCLDYGLNPLTVTWKTPGRTELGARNLANLISLGVDHIDYQINPVVEKKFLYQALDRFGTPAIPQHMAIFSIPLRMAAKFNIPLVVWGENSAFEYGTKEEKYTGLRLDGNWLKKFGVTHGTTAKDWVSNELSEKELTPYFWPADEELENKGVMAVFLGYYFQWDPEVSLTTAEAHGFRTRYEGPKTGYYDYADIDCDFISVHHYIKWYKFGFTRLFDNLSLEIRNGRVSRENALDILRNNGDQKPVEDIRKTCHFMGMSEDRFYEILEKFRNHHIWGKDKGTWKINNFIIKDWKWL